MSHFHRLLFIGLIGIAACGKGGPNLSDAGGTDANQFDAQIPDTTAPDTTITAQPPALTNNATAHFEFASTEDSSTFACAIDGAAAQPCTSPFEMQVAEGAHTFSVAATDRAGNVDPTPATASWTVDLTPPDTTITKNPPLIDNSVNVELDFTATEDGSTFECMVDTGAWTACTTPDLLTGLTDGSHTFSVRATDPAGNVDATPATYTWTIDTSTPDTVIDGGPTGAVQATSATFTFHSPNAGAGATFKCALDAAAATSCTSPIAYGSLSEAMHTFTVAVTNAAGTSDPTPATQTWTVDHTAPTVTITGGPNGPTNDKTPTFPFTTAGNPTVIECAVDTGAFAACTSPFTTASLADGAHKVTVRVTDAAGNQGSDSRSFTVDTVGPTVTITSGPAPLTKQTGAMFAFTASESPVTYACALDGAAFTSCATGVAYASLVDGAHTFAVRATDAATNTGPAATWTWTVDTVGPTVLIDAPLPISPTNATSATFTFHSPSDANATYSCAIDGGAFASCATGQQYTSLTGGAGTSHTFRVEATDAAGNTGAPASFTWTIDTQAPTIAIDAPTPASPTNATSATFTFHSPSDANASYQCHIDTASYTACTPGVSYAGLTGGAGTSHSFHVRAIDTAGNVGAGTTFTWTIDTQGPTVVIDAPTPASPTNATSATFTFHSADGGTSFACSIDGGGFASCASGKTYTNLTGGAGTSHTFQVQATDDASNTGSPASFTWTIDTQGPTVVIDTHPANPTASTSATFTFHSADGGTSFACSIDGGAFTACATGQAYSSLTGGAGTSHTFQVKATDAATNTGAPASFTWTIDTQGATVAIDTHPANPTASTSATFTFHSPSDANATFSCAIDGGGFASCASGKTYTNLTGGAGTSHTFQVEATDALGNTGAAVAFTWTIDTQGPTVAIDTHPANPTNGTSASFTFHSPSDASATFQCAIDGGGFASCASGKTYASLTGGTGTSHTFQVEATDTLGNTGAAVAFTWTIDTSAPTVTIDAPTPSNPTKQTSATFTFHSADGGTSYQCQMDGGGFSACTSTTSYSSLSGANQTGTSHTFQVRASDAAGNTGGAASFTWTVDTTPPNTTIASNPPNPTASGAASFTFTANETSTFTCQLDSNAATACNGGSASYSGLSNATHTFSVYATDTALNADASPATYSWVVNSGPPTITQAPPAGWTVNYFPFAFTGPVANPSSYQCSTDGTTWATCTSPRTVTGAIYGATNKFVVRWVDSAGNVSAATTANWTPNQGLVLYYPFDTDLKNRSILAGYYNHDGSGPGTFGGGYAGGALTPTNAITLNNTIQPMTSASAYTISFWTNAYQSPNADSGYAQGPILSTIDTAQNLGGCSIKNGIRAIFTVSCYANPGGILPTTTATITSVGIWQNVMLSYAGPGASVQIYLNGTLRGTVTNAKAWEVFSQFQLKNMIVGGTPNDANTPLIPIDDLRVYNKAFNPTQICSLLYGTVDGNNICHPVLPGDDVSFELGQLFNWGSWQDATSSTAGTFTFQSGKVGSGIYVKPTAVTAQPVSVDLAAASLTAPAHTLSLWFMDPSGKGDQFLFSDESDYGYRIRATAGTLQISGQGVDTNGKLVPINATITTQYATGKWHQLMWVEDDTVSLAGGKAFGTNEIDFYLDGSLTKVVPVSPAATFWINGTGSTSVGVSPTGMPQPPLPDFYVDELKHWPYDLVQMTNAQGDQEALCLLGFGGTFDFTTGNCTYP